MKLASKPKFLTGIIIIIILILSYFININTYAEAGSNYETADKLLGILIFHNPIVLLVYLIAISILIVTGIKKIMLI